MRWPLTLFRDRSRRCWPSLGKESGYRAWTEPNRVRVVGRCSRTTVDQRRSFQVQDEEIRTCPKYFKIKTWLVHCISTVFLSFTLKQTHQAVQVTNRLCLCLNFCYVLALPTPLHGKQTFVRLYGPIRRSVAPEGYCHFISLE